MQQHAIDNDIAYLENLHAGLLARGVCASDVRTGLFNLHDQLMAAATFCNMAAETLRIAMRPAQAVEIEPGDSDQVVAAKFRAARLRALDVAEDFLDALSPDDAGQALETLRSLCARLDARQALGRSTAETPKPLMRPQRRTC